MHVFATYVLGTHRAGYTTCKTPGYLLCDASVFKAEILNLASFTVESFIEMFMCTLQFSS